MEPAREENSGTEQFGAGEAACCWWDASAGQSWNQSAEKQSDQIICVCPFKAQQGHFFFFSWKKALYTTYMEFLFFQIAPLMSFEIINAQ